MSTTSDSDLLALGKELHNRLVKEAKPRFEVAHYGCAWTDGKHKIFVNTACHMGLMSSNYNATDNILRRKIGGPVVISNRMQVNRKSGGNSWCGKEHMERYYSFLFNESVFADCYVTKDVERCFEDGITVRTDRPANLVVAACIATRQVWEYPSVSRSVSNLIKFGVDPRKAHLAGHLISVKDNGSYVEDTRCGHISIYISQMNHVGVGNFLKAELKGNHRANKDTYQNLLTYGGIPYMWGDDRYGRYLKIKGGGRATTPTSDPFGYVKTIGVTNFSVVKQVNEAFKILGVK